MAPKRKNKNKKRKIRAKMHKTQLKRTGTASKELSRLTKPGTPQKTPLKAQELSSGKKKSQLRIIPEINIESSNSEDSGPTQSKQPNTTDSGDDYAIGSPHMHSGIIVESYRRSWSNVLVPNRKKEWSFELDDSSGTDDTWELISEEDSNFESGDENINHIIEMQQQLSQTCNKIIIRLDAIEQKLKTVNVEELKINDKSSRLNVLMDGLPAWIKVQYIIQDLKSKGFDPVKTARVKETADSPSELISFELPKSQDHIFYLSCCLGFPVIITKRFMSFDSAFLGPNDSFVQDIHGVFVVLIGIPVGVPARFAEEDLKRKMFKPMIVSRMMKPSFSMKNLPMPYIYVEVPQHQNYIVELKCLLGMPVTVIEYVKEHWTVMQCNVCRRFGHVAKFCKNNEGVEEERPSNDYENIMIEGIPCEYTIGKVLEFMENCGYTPIALHRMVEENESLPSCLVKLPTNQVGRSLLLDCFLGFNIQVEKFLPIKYMIKECPKCGVFIHNSCEKCELMSEVSTQTVEASSLQTQKDLISDIGETASTILEECTDFPLEARNQMFRLLVDMGKIGGPWDKFFSNLTMKKSAIRGNMQTMLNGYIKNINSCIDLMIKSDGTFEATSHDLNELLHLLEKLEESEKVSTKTLPSITSSNFPTLEEMIFDNSS